MKNRHLRRKEGRKIRRKEGRGKRKKPVIIMKSHGSNKRYFLKMSKLEN